jgi:hypothetical protein
MKGRIPLGLVAGALLIAACAHVEPPPGGEEDRTPPVLVAVTPDSLAVVAAFRDPVVFSFDERIAEQGVQDVAIVSPRTSEVQVSRRGGDLRVSLREGWHAGQIYHVTLRPTLQDLWNNRLPAPVRVVFSTGPAIPDTHLSGTVVDRITGRPEVDVRVEAIRTTDSLVYALPTDSAGAFTFRQIPEGQYRVRALRDLNRNRVLDAFEPRDTAAATVAAADSGRVQLAIVMPDSTPPAVASARLAAAQIEVVFDDHLDPDQVISPGEIQILAPDGTQIPVARASVGRLERSDTTTAADTAGAPVTPRQPTARPATAAGPAQTPRLPSQNLAIEPATPLAPNTEYRVRVERVRNVVGLAGGGEATVTTPAAAPGQ